MAGPVQAMTSDAQWIWAGGEYATLHNVYADFVREVTLDAPPENAVVEVTADAEYVLWVNGRYVNRGPARGFQASWPVDRHDLSPLLRAGKNVIAVRVHNPGRGTFRYVHEAAAGLLVRGRIGDVDVSSGPDWRCRLDASHARLTPRLSAQMGFQEHVDLRFADGWRKEGVSGVGPDVEVGDDPLGGCAAWYRWGEPRVRRPQGAAPWHATEPRDVPPLTDHLTLMGPPVAAAAGPAAELGADPSQRLRAMLPGLRWGEAAGQGEATVLMFDLGRTRIGLPWLHVTGGAAGDVVDLVFAQAVDGQGRPVVPPADERNRISMAARLTLSDKGDERWQAFGPLGFRYLVAVLPAGSAGEVDAALRETVYPLQIEGGFDTDAADVNAIWAMCRETQRVCLTDAYTDTPYREQAQWWGDVRVQSQNTFHLADDTRPLTRGLRQVTQQQLANGLTYGHVPTNGHTCILPDFSLIWLLTLWDHYRQTGRTTEFRRHRAAAERVLSYFRTDGPEGGVDPATGLLRHDPRYWLFLDWADLHDTGVPTLLNLWHVEALRRLAELAEADGDDAAAGAWRDERLRQAQRIETHLYDADARLHRDGLDAAGDPVGRRSIHCQTLAYLTGLGDAATQRRRVIDYLAGELHGGAAPSSYWCTYVYDAAERIGLGREMLRHLVDRWRPMLPYGGCFESFRTAEALEQETVSHAWAAHPLFHLMRTLGGVRQAEGPAGAGWRRVDFAPVLDAGAAVGVGRASATYPTPAGRIVAAWERRGAETEVRLSLPETVTAAVSLSGVTEEVTGGERSWTIRD